ncbi:hypothetical protein IMSAGC005_01081 [Lachnospiraceae bacterium]|nr:hypothetical protein IMSAGC005_01081 [Lachnospiraceae bacterium]
MKEYKFDSVQAFYKELNAAEKENRDYKAARTEWEKVYGNKTADSIVGLCPLIFHLSKVLSISSRTD